MGYLLSHCRQVNEDLLLCDAWQFLKVLCHQAHVSEERWPAIPLLSHHLEVLIELFRVHLKKAVDESGVRGRSLGCL